MAPSSGQVSCNCQATEQVSSPRHTVFVNIRIRICALSNIPRVPSPRLIKGAGVPAGGFSKRSDSCRRSRGRQEKAEVRLLLLPWLLLLQ